MAHDLEDVLAFWFGALDATGSADEAHATRWFQGDPAFDEEVRARFEAVHRDVAAGGCEAWRSTPRGCLAYVVVLDQFSRNMFRNTSRMFAFDAAALNVALQALDRGVDRTLGFDERTFLYMPLLHSEDALLQARSVALFRALRDEAAAPLRAKAERTLSFAERHAEIVQRFGRFPHRNALVGRATTPEETAFLQQPGSSFLGGGAATPGTFPNWEVLYKNEAVERMPWFYEPLDPDVAQAVEARAIRGRGLDLGTGPGTQALALARRGVEMVGTDLSPTAIAKARERAVAQDANVRFEQDDVVATRLVGPFDFALDRGCFHVLPPDQRGTYVRNVAKLLRPGGTLLFKCFSEEQPGTQGPHRFAPDQIPALFEPSFRVVSIARTVYHGTLDPMPRALFCVMTRA